MCDALIALPAATGAAAALFAKNSDRPPDEAQDVRWSPERHDHSPVHATHIAVPPHPEPTLGCLLSQPRWCWGAEHGVNTAGVAIGNEAIYTTLDPRSAAPALIGMDLVRLGLERAPTAAAAVVVITHLLEVHGQGGSGHDPRRAPRPYWSSFLVADPTEAYVIETSGTVWEVERVDPVVGVRAISNRTTIPAFDELHRHPRQPVERFVDARLEASRRTLARRPVDRSALQSHLRSHDSCAEEGWSVCMHVPGVEATTASMVAALASDGGPHRAWVLVGHPCEETYHEVVVGEPFEPILWERRRGA